MDSVFKYGDIVHHPEHGEVTVINPSDGDLKIKMKDGYSQYTVKNLLSFSPWPKPNHERPFMEVGWWVCKATEWESNYLVRWRFSEKVYGRDQHCESKDRYTDTGKTIWIKFLGKEM